MFSNLNNNTLFIGILTLILNMGGKSVSFKLNKKQEYLFNNSIMKSILIFGVFFTTTRNIFLAIGLTVLFYLLVNHFLNDESKLCIMPKKLKEFESMIDSNNDGVISAEELENAKKILKSASITQNKQNDKKTKHNKTVDTDSSSSEDESALNTIKLLKKKYRKYRNRPTVVTVVEDDELLYPIVVNGRGVF
jgi:hypothetical protein